MKQTVARASKSRVSRFAIVGVFNTLFDFAVLNVLLFGTGRADSKTAVIVFNTISASMAALVSFFLNRNFVFRSKNTPSHYAVYFILITLTGLYIIQNSIIWLVLHGFDGVAGSIHDFLATLGISLFSAQFILINGAKAIGTVGSLIWNYNLYKRFIFR